jgi:long-chain acyl-CoA synthetase
MSKITYLKKLNELWRKNKPSFLPEEPFYPLGKVLLTEYLHKRAQLTPDKPVIIFYGKELTFKQLDNLSDRFAAFLSGKGYKKGDRVAVYLPSCPQFLIAFYGIIKLGCVHVPVNPMFMKQELLYELNDSGSKVIVALDRLYPVVNAVKKETSLELIITTSYADYLPEKPTITVHESLLNPPRQECPGSVDMISMLQQQKPDYLKPEVSLDDVVALNYTGGTTGMPKGCQHTQSNMLYMAAATATYGRVSNENDIALSYLPVFWIAGENIGVILPVFAGTSTILMARWDVVAMMEAIQYYQVTVTGGVLDNIVELMEHPDVGKYDLSSIKSISVSSFVKKMNIDYRRQWRKVAKGSRSVLREASYGLTETHTNNTYTTGLQEDDMDLKSQPVFCGLPVPGTEFMIVDFETKKPVRLGKEGEIVVRAPSLMKGYWNKPEETNRDLRDGWFYTGDIGVLDEGGYLHFLGRIKEMLKVKGMSVFPSELEVLIGRHPAVEGCGVVGKPDPVKGQIPMAFIKLKPEAVGKIDEAELTRWCRENMATYKVPVIRIERELPLTTTRKIKKGELLKLIAAKERFTP